jgi:hypothetical protein
MKQISVLNDFTEDPGLRHCSISDFSGEQFYHAVLNKAFYDAIISKSKLLIDLDETSGYASSFLDEAFGNLVFDFGLDNEIKYIELKSNQEPHWKDMINDKTFKQWEKRRINGESPKVTKIHSEWYRYTGSSFDKKIWEHPL